MSETVRRIEQLYRWVCVQEQRWSAAVYGYDHEATAELAEVRDEMERLWPHLKDYSRHLDWDEITKEARLQTKESPSLGDPKTECNVCGRKSWLGPPPPNRLVVCRMPQPDGSLCPGKLKEL